MYCALIAYIIFEGPAEDRNMNTLVDMISGMEVKEDDENFMNAVDYMFKGLEKRKPDCFAVKQYKKYKLASGVVCSKRLLNQAVGKSLRTHNLKPKKGAQVMRKNEKITALYERLSRDDFGKDDDQQRESNSISNQELICKGWFLPPNTYDCGSFVVNGTAVVGKEPKKPYNRWKSTQKGADFYEIVYLSKWAALTVRRVIILSRTLRCRMSQNTRSASTGVCAAAI